MAPGGFRTLESRPFQIVRRRSDRIPSFGKETWREFLFSFQPFKRSTLRKGGHRQPQLRAPVPSRPAAPTPDPRIRFDRIASAPKHNTEGQVLGADQMPQRGAKLTFVSAEITGGGRQPVRADGQGRFRTTLAAGTGLIYVEDGSAKLVCQGR
jgi:hypothetical protein